MSQSERVHGLSKVKTPLTNRLYETAPAVIQDAICSFYGYRKIRYRFSHNYKYWREYFEAGRHLSASELKELQREKLRSMVKHCYQTVPYWRELFVKLSLCPDDIRDVDDLPKLPILEKQDVVAAGQKMISTDFRGPVHRVPTSGSTGTPLTTMWNQDIANMEFAFVWTRYRHDCTPNDSYSSFSGLDIVKASRKRPPFWRNNWFARQRMYSIFHMSDATLGHYVNSLNRRYSKYYTGYASAVYVIVDYMERMGLRLDSAPDLFFAASEELQPAHEEKIARVLGCRMYNRYGQGELVGSITKYPCEHLHYDMDYSIIEFLPVGNEDGLIKAEIIGTHLHHYAWPLLRYRTGDLVLFDPNDRCEMGTPGQIVRRIYGRVGHYFILPDGRHICNISVIAKKCHNIRFMQVVQDKLGELTVRVVRGPNYSTKDEAEILKQFRCKIGRYLKLRIDYVEDVQRTKAGKYLSIINRLQQADSNKPSAR